jgi:signal transduction histidine kinase/ligand-binding sensor domain-containing protein
VRIVRFIVETPFIRVALLLVNFLLSQKSIAQEFEISFRQFREHNGLSNEQVRCLHFGSDGFLWIGTNDGLNRFDGKEFFAFRNVPNDPNTIPGNTISDIKEDREGRLWITTRDGGICSFDRKSQKFKSYELTNSKDSSLVKMAFCLDFDENDRLHVGTKYGVFISNNKNDFWHVEAKRQAQVMDLELTSRGLFVGAIVTGIGEIKNDNYSLFPRSSFAPQKNIVVEKYFEDSQKRIWLGAWDNMFHELLPNNTLRHINFSGASEFQSNGYEIHAITEVENGILWLGILNGDLWRYDVANDKCDRLRVSSYVNSRINGSRIYCMITDPQGRVWVGTNAGLYMYDPAKLPFNVTWFENGASVNQFIEYENNLLVGTNDGLYTSQTTSTQVARISNMPDKEVHSFFIDQNNDLFVGTNRAIHKFDLSKQRFTFPFKVNPVLHLGDITSSKVNAIGQLTLEGVDLLAVNAFGHGTALINKTSGEYMLTYLSDSTKIDNLVLQLFNDSKNNLWCIGNVLGITRIRNINHNDTKLDMKNWDMSVIRKTPVFSMVRTYLQEGIPTNIMAIHEDKAGDLWVAARSAGLLKFNPSNSSELYTKIPNSPRSIESIANDNEGNLWMNSSGSLYCYQPKANRWLKYTANDGIPHAGLSGKIYLAQNGNIFVGGNGFFLKLDPQNTVGKTEIPKATITHIKVLDNYMDSLIGIPNITLKADQNFITFQFSSLCFSNPESITFEYMLEGIENVWHPTNYNDFISFTQLPYGRYTFHLRARQNGSSAEFSEVEQTFTILAPYYRRAWFICLILATAFTLLALFIRSKIKEKKHMEKIRNKIARDLHDDIGSALGSISFYSETAIKNLDASKAKEASIILQKMGSTSREMIENMHDIVWTVNPQNDDPNKLIERIHNFAKEVCSSNNIKLQFDASRLNLQKNLSMDVRKNIYLILKEGVYNAVKYSHSEEITIRFSTEHGKNILEITDKGVGFDPASKLFGGNGLKNMRARAYEIRGEISIHSSPGNGTLITLIF